MFRVEIMPAWYVLCSGKLDGKALWWPVFQEIDRQNYLQQDVGKFHLITCQKIK